MLDFTQPAPIDALQQIFDEWFDVYTTPGPTDHDAGDAAIRYAYTAASVDPPSQILWRRDPKEANAVAADINSTRMCVDIMLSKGCSNTTDWLHFAIRQSKLARIDRIHEEIGVNTPASFLHSANQIAHTNTQAGLGAWSYEPDRAKVQLVRAGVHFCWAFDDVAVLTERHTGISLDEDNRLHSATGPAMEWSSGYAIYAWHGSIVPKKWIEDAPLLDDVLSHTNIEQRRVAAEILGWDAVLNQLDPEVVDEDPDPGIGTLLRVDLPDAAGSTFLKVRCGTGLTFVLAVPDWMTSALQANAWTYNLTPDDFLLFQART